MELQRALTSKRRAQVPFYICDRFLVDGIVDTGTVSSAEYMAAECYGDDEVEAVMPLLPLSVMPRF